MAPSKKKKKKTCNVYPNVKKQKHTTNSTQITMYSENNNNNKIMLTCNVYRSILMSIDNNNLVDNYPS